MISLDDTIDTDGKLAQLARDIAHEVSAEMQRTREQNGTKAQAGDYISDVARRLDAIVKPEI